MRIFPKFGFPRHQERKLTAVLRAPKSRGAPTPGPPRITVVVDAKLHVLTFSDNGPGISEALKEDVFRPFFSTKDRRRRQGLGLYIARECANYNESQLYLSDEHTEHETRLNTFVLELAKPNAR